MHAEQNYHITELELLAVIEALKAFRCYVAQGIPFNLVTDQNLRHSMTLNLHCQGDRLAGASTYSASTSPGNTETRQDQCS